MSYRVGLTGGIGSGKSTVATLFAELGVPVIDTDAISHQLTQAGGTAMPAIRNAFGNGYIEATGALDRSKMRQLVFSDSVAKQTLEGILHPLIFAEAKRRAKASSAPYVLIVVPLLFETPSFREWVDRTLTVDCSETTQIARVSPRQGLNVETVQTIIAQQLPRQQRLLLADDSLKNEGTPEELRTHVYSLNQRYLDLAKRSN
jgi:dephospho-CoA kinase